MLRTCSRVVRPSLLVCRPARWQNSRGAWWSSLIQAPPETTHSLAPAAHQGSQAGAGHAKSGGPRGPRAEDDWETEKRPHDGPSVRRQDIRPDDVSFAKAASMDDGAAPVGQKPSAAGEASSTPPKVESFGNGSKDRTPNSETAQAEVADAAESRSEWQKMKEEWSKEGQEERELPAPAEEQASKATTPTKAWHGAYGSKSHADEQDPGPSPVTSPRKPQALEDKNGTKSPRAASKASPMKPTLVDLKDSTAALLRDLIHPDARFALSRVLYKGGLDEMAAQALYAMLSGRDTFVVGRGIRQKPMRYAYALIALHNNASRVSSAAGSFAVLKALKETQGVHTLIVCDNEDEAGATTSLVAHLLGAKAKSDLVRVQAGSHRLVDDELHRVAQIGLRKRGRIVVAGSNIELDNCLRSSKTAELFVRVDTVIVNGIHDMTWQRRDHNYNTLYPFLLDHKPVISTYARTLTKTARGFAVLQQARTKPHAEHGDCAVFSKPHFNRGASACSIDQLLAEEEKEWSRRHVGKVRHIHHR